VYLAGARLALSTPPEPILSYPTIMALVIVIAIFFLAEIKHVVTSHIIGGNLNEQATQITKSKAIPKTNF
jgi:hypothetical protein